MARAILWSAAFVLAAVTCAQDQPKTKIRQVPPSATSPASGQEMFRAYCASCHGMQGNGNGPAVPALKKTPPDLTTLAKRNQGKFPALAVYNQIQGDTMAAAHGNKDMPVWGDVFRSMARSDAESKMRLNNLTKYIESIQVK